MLDQGVVQIIHIGITAIPWIIALFVRNPIVLMLCLAAQLLVMTQWLVLGHCILNPLENNGSTTSITIERVAGWMKIPVEAFEKGFVLINAAAPSFLKLSRLAAALGL